MAVKLDFELKSTAHIFAAPDPPASDRQADVGAVVDLLMPQP
jgi:hypothetical protein